MLKHFKSVTSSCWCTKTQRKKESTCRIHLAIFIIAYVNQMLAARMEGTTRCAYRCVTYKLADNMDKLFMAHVCASYDKEELIIGFAILEAHLKSI